MDLDFRQFQDRAWEDKVPLIERSLSLLLDLGIYEGARFHEWIKERLAAKGVHTFADLVREGDEDPRRRYDLQVIASTSRSTSCSCCRATQPSSASSPTNSRSPSPCG